MPSRPTSSVPGPTPGTGRQSPWRWAGAVAVALALALGLQAVRLQRRSADLDRRERSLAETKGLLTRIQATIDAKEKKLRQLADNLERMQREIAAMLPPELPPTVDGGVQRAAHRATGPLPDLPPEGP